MDKAAMRQGRGGIESGASGLIWQDWEGLSVEMRKSRGPWDW